MSKIIIPKSVTLSYPVICDSYPNISNALEIWIKFTSIFSEEEINYINELNQTPLSLMQTDKIQEYLKIRERMELSKLLIKYKNRECTQEEHDRVVIFMRSTSLKSLVNSMISEEVKNEVSLILDELRTVDDLKRYIASKDGCYTELSIRDAYTLFSAKERLYNLEQSDLNNQIKNKQTANAINLKRSMIKDYGHTI